MIPKLLPLKQRQQLEQRSCKVVGIVTSGDWLVLEPLSEAVRDAI